MRLIDADALMKVLGITDMDCDKCEWQSGYGSYCSRGNDFTDACSAIEDAPTIDAVEVVRCRNCRWWEREQPGMVYCPNTVGNWVEDDWYCKGGERRGEEDDNM